MSRTFNSYAVVGVPLDRLLETKKVKKLITKYNEDTGEPYQLEAIETHYLWCDIEVEAPDDMEDFVKKMCDLGIYDTDSYDDDNNPIVGIKLGCSKPGRIVSVNKNDINKTWTDVKEKLQKSGYKNNDIQLHIIGYIS